MTRVIFGDTCPLISPLPSLRRMLSKAPLFGAWRKTNYANLTWRIHIGIRHIFNLAGGLQALVRVANDLTALHHFGDGGAPEQYIKEPKTSDDHAPIGGHKRKADDEPYGGVTKPKK